MPQRVKICGLRTPAALAAVAAAGADYGGFIFYRQSPRWIAPEEALLLARHAEGLRKVGVFVDADEALLKASAPAIDIFQLQGRETPARVAEVRRRFGKPVWKAVGVATADDVAAAARAFAGADLLLFDAQPAAGASGEEKTIAALPGGNGLRFDWRILAGAAIPGDWGLAGGLRPENVGEAIRKTGAPLVDVSSGVERAPGVKDVAKIAAFVKAARRV